MLEADVIPVICQIAVERFGAACLFSASRQNLLLWRNFPCKCFSISLNEQELIYRLSFHIPCTYQCGTRIVIGEGNEELPNFLCVFFSAAVGVGFYGNEDAHKGVSQFAKSGSDADNTIHAMQRQVSDAVRAGVKFDSVTESSVVDKLQSEVHQQGTVLIDAAS